MTAHSAELAYLFRHALLRDAAYQLQVPTERARLHALAFHLIEQAFGGRAPELPPLDAIDPPKLEPHSTDSVAAELADHARLAMGERENLRAEYMLYLHRAAEYAERKFQGEDAAAGWELLGSLLRGAASREALRRASVVLYRIGQIHKGEASLKEAIAIQGEQGDRRAMGIALGSLAGVYDHTGRIELAERTYEQALGIHRHVGNLRAEGITLANLAGVYHHTGRAGLAEGTYEQALAIHRDVGDQRSECIALGNLASVYLESSRIELAERGYGQALAVLGEFGDRRLEGSTLGNLAGVYLESGRLELAENTYQRALAIHREVGNRRSEGIALGELAMVYEQTDRIEHAQRAYGQALAIHREVGNRRFEGVHLCCNGLSALATSWADARELWLQGAAILSRLGATADLERRTTIMRQACAKAGVPPFDE